MPLRCRGAREPRGESSEAISRRRPSPEPPATPAAGGAGDAGVAARRRSASRPPLHRPRPPLRPRCPAAGPRKVGGDYLGVDVNVAARLCDAAKLGEILVSDRILLHLDPSRVSSKNRRFRAKGAPKELAVYAVTRANS